MRCAEIQKLRVQLEQNTRNAVTFADKSAEQMQHSSGDGMLNAVQSISDAVDVTVTKARDQRELHTDAHQTHHTHTPYLTHV